MINLGVFRLDEISAVTDPNRFQTLTTWNSCASLHVEITINFYSARAILQSQTTSKSYNPKQEILRQSEIGSGYVLHSNRRTYVPRIAAVMLYDEFHPQILAHDDRFTRKPILARVTRIFCLDKIIIATYS